MSIFANTLVVLIIGLSSINAYAELISTDWRTQDDSLSTLDRKTGIEWMDLSQTAGKSFNQVLTEFEGWRLPTETELRGLFLSYLPSIEPNFDTPTRTDYTKGAWHHFVNKAEYDEITAFTAFIGSGYASYIGDDGQGHMASALKGTGTKASWYGFGSNTPLSTMDASNPSYTIYLVNDGGVTLSSINDPSLNINNANSPINATPVPVPASLGLFALVIAGFSFRTTKNK